MLLPSILISTIISTSTLSLAAPHVLRSHIIERSEAHAWIQSVPKGAGWDHGNPQLALYPQPSAPNGTPLDCVPFEKKLGEEIQVYFGAGQSRVYRIWAFFGEGCTDKVPYDIVSYGYNVPQKYGTTESDTKEWKSVRVVQEASETSHDHEGLGGANIGRTG